MRGGWRVWMVVVVALGVVAGCVPSLDRGDGSDAEEVAEELPRVPVVVVLDASGSMKVEDAPGQRFAAAQAAVKGLAGDLSDGHEIGLTAYGTSTGSSDEDEAEGCKDVKQVVPFGELDRDAFTSAVDGLKPSGYTPIGAALENAAAQLPSSGKRAVVLVSDGVDTCAPPDPCEVAKGLHDADTDLVIHTVAFRVAEEPKAREQLSCIAQAGAGLDLDASSGSLLRTRLLAAFDPARAAGSLQPSGYRGLEPGMSVEQAREAAPKLGEVGSKGRVEIVYVDCTLVFDDGVLVEIAPKGGKVRTLDGIGVGDDVTTAQEVYGTSGQPVEVGRKTVTYAADHELGTGYRITFDPSKDSTAEKPEGTITRIVLCACSPRATGLLSDVEEIDPGEIPGPGSAGGSAGALRAEHATLGTVYLNLGVQEGEAVVVGFDADGERLWTSDPIAIYETEVNFLDPPSDASGNVFVRFNPGRYEGLVIIRGTADGFEELVQSRRDGSGYAGGFYDAKPEGPGEDGYYVILQSSNSCDPTCAEGRVSEDRLVWDGQEYVSVFVAEPGSLGPIVLGSEATSLLESGYVSDQGDDSCGFRWNGDRLPAGVALDFRAQDPDDLDQISVFDPGESQTSRPRTAEGLGIGSTLGQLRAIYGDGLVYRSWVEEGGEGDGWVVFGPRGSLVFGFGYSGDGEGAHDDTGDVVTALRITKGSTPETFVEPFSGC